MGRTMGVRRDIGISEGKLKHMLGVAEKARAIGYERGYQSAEELQDLFVMGFLHDIGYQFCVWPEDHAVVGGVILERLGFPYAKEIKYHGDPVSAYESEWLDILNAADMQVGPNGEEMTFDERLNDIKGRYGDASPQYLDSKAVCMQLKSRGYGG